MKETRCTQTLNAVVLLAALTMSVTGSAAATKEKVLEAFSGINGSISFAGLLPDSSGNLYGTTYGGGAHGSGTVFELAPTNGGWTETVLYSFCSAANCTDGWEPVGGLIFDSAGNLYGTTKNGGTSSTGGVVFELTPTSNGWTETVLYNFCSAANCIDGENPYSTLIFDSAGNLYGTTYNGGAANLGSVFKLTPISGGWAESVLFNFCSSADCIDGEAPNAGVVLDSAGNLYGTALFGGASGYGVVYQLTPNSSGWTENVIHAFTAGSDGANPYSGLLLDPAGNLYGTTPYGGTFNRLCSSGCGVVFQLTPTVGGWTENVLHAFSGGKDGHYSFAGLIFDSAGRLYGTTGEGGTASNSGVAFALTPISGIWKETVLHAFTAGTDGANPYAALVLDSRNKLYGTTGYGGIQGEGVVFVVQK